MSIKLIASRIPVPCFPLIIFLLLSSGALAQNDSTEMSSDTVGKKWALDGYFSDTYSAGFTKLQSNWVNDNLLLNRINFKWFPSEQLTFSAGIRSRLFSGESIKSLPPKAGKDLGKDAGKADITATVFSKRSHALVTAIDRLSVDYERNKWHLTVGRQRINWGLNHVWNPNDLFNNYSIYDINYPERPGSDAVRVQYYTGAASSVEVAAKINHENKKTIAGLVKFNKWNYDFQAVSGLLEGKDYVLGAGWAGSIKRAGFRGEVSYLHPSKKSADTSGILVASTGFDYTFPNTLGLQLEFLYNQQSEKTVLTYENIAAVYSAPLSVRSLSFSEFNILGTGNYNITPLLKSSLSYMFIPNFNGHFLSPSFTYSVSDNSELALLAQSFQIRQKRLPELYYTSVFLRFKMNF